MAAKRKKTTARESALDPSKLARVFLNNHAKGAGNQWTLRYWRGDWWRWKCCSYSRQSRDGLKVELAAALKEHVNNVSLVDREGTLVKVTPDLVSKVTLSLSATVCVAEDVEMPQWLHETSSSVRDSVTVKNGIIELQPEGDRVFRKHSPAWFTAVCLPHHYDAGATAPRWEAFLKEVLEGDAERTNLLQEWFGYSLVYDTKLHKFMMLEGDGANGKSVVLEVLGALLGEDNVSAVPLELFGQRFQLTPTLQKLANIAPETDEKARVDLGTLKQFVAGELMQWDRKGIEQIQARPTARLIVATNNRPVFADRSSGLWRRLLFIPFRVTIAPDRQDPELVGKLKAELPGILNWALEGLARLRQQGRFTRSAVGEAALNDYQQESHPEKVFLAEHCEADSTGEIATAALFGNYKEWSKTNNYPAVDERTFGKAVVRMFPKVDKRRVKRNGSRYYVYAGISFIPEADLSNGSNVTEEKSPGPKLSIVSAA